MGKLNKVLAMSLAALTLASSSSQVFAARSRRSSFSKSRRSSLRKSDSRKQARRNSYSVDYTSYTHTVKEWFKRFKQKVGETEQLGNRSYDTALTPDVVEAAKAILTKRGKKVSGFYEATIVMSQYNKKVENDKVVYGSAEKIVRVTPLCPEEKNKYNRG